MKRILLFKPQRLSDTSAVFFSPEIQSWRRSSGMFVCEVDYYDIWQPKQADNILFKLTDASLWKKLISAVIVAE